MDAKLLGKRIKSRRMELHMTQGDIANPIGVAISTIQRYEAGTIQKIKLPVVESIARMLKVDPSWLIGKTDEMNVMPDFPSPGITEDVVTFPIITEVAAHYDAFSYDESVVGDTVDIPRRYLRGRPEIDYCVMRVKGDSMYPDYRDGDLVLVLKQDTLNRPGEIGVINYEDGELTLKRIDYVAGEDWLELIPINPMYPPKKIEGIDLKCCKVIGVPRLLIREI